MSGKRKQPNDDVFKGYRFHVSPRPAVPESVRQHDQEFHPGPEEDLPNYGSDLHGIWMPELKSWKEIIAESRKNKQ